MLGNRGLIITVFILYLLCGCEYNYSCLNDQNTKEIVITEGNTKIYRRITNPAKITKAKNIIADNIKKAKKSDDIIITDGFNGMKVLFISDKDTVCVLFNYDKATLYYQQENCWVCSNVYYETGRFLEQMR